MSLESGTYISDLVATNPTSSDPKSQGDDHIRLLKSTVKATFPNVAGAVTPTHTELNFVDGVTSAIQGQIDSKGAITGQTWSGTHTFPATVAIGDVSATEISYINGVTSAVQTQIDSKGAITGQTWTGTHSFAATTSIGNVSATEITYLDGVTGAIQTQIDAKGAITGQAWTGSHTFPTQSALDNSTKAATTAYADAGDAVVAASVAAKANLASPTFTGVPSAPTATVGTATTQIATTAFVGATAFNSALPSQTGNSGKFVTTDGTNASWELVQAPLISGTNIKTLNSTSLLGSGNINIEAGIATVTTASTTAQTTLTSAKVIVKCVPTVYGTSVKAADATTCSVVDVQYVIDNSAGAYPVKFLDSVGTLKAFIFPGVVSRVSLTDNSTAAGTWAVENGERVGASAQLLTTNLATMANTNPSVIALDSDREFIIGWSAAVVYGVVYRKSTNVFGAVSAIRTVSMNESRVASILQTTNQVLVVSCDPTTGFEAVICSVNASTDAITVNTAATATLSGNCHTFAVGSGLIAVGSSFVTSYRFATPEAQIRALSVSGTTVTIGAATVVDGLNNAINSGSPIHAIGSVVIALSHTYTTAIYITPYTVSGTTLTRGTGASRSGSACYESYFINPGSGRLIAIYQTAGSIGEAAVVTLTGTTVTLSTVTLLATLPSDAMMIGANKLVVACNLATDHINILTDTAGVASAGAAITLTNLSTARPFLYAIGTTAYLYEHAQPKLQIVDCSGASPVKTGGVSIASGNSNVSPGFLASNTVSKKSINAVYGSNFAQCLSIYGATTAGAFLPRLEGGAVQFKAPAGGVFGAPIRGKADSERWILDAPVGTITKVECVS